MPNYTFSCEKCGEFEVYHRMSEKHPTKCTTCNGSISRIFDQRFTPPADTGWEYENNGKGRFIGSIGDHKDSNCYCRSRMEAKEKLIKRGYSPSQVEFV